MSPLSSSMHHHHNRNTHNHHGNNMTVRDEPRTTQQPPPPPSEQQQLLGDISPIKVTYGRYHRTAQPLFGETSVMLDEWQQHDRDIEEPDANVMTGGAPAVAAPTTRQQQQQKQPSPLSATANAETKSTSDPMKVLQAAKHNFCHMKYLLSSLKTTPTIVTAATVIDENCAEDGTELYNSEASVRCTLVSMVRRYVDLLTDGLPAWFIFCLDKYTGQQEDRTASRGNRDLCFWRSGAETNRRQRKTATTTTTTRCEAILHLSTQRTAAALRKDATKSVPDERFWDPMGSGREPARRNTIVIVFGRFINYSQED
jgi:hypothetical protein